MKKMYVLLASMFLIAIVPITALASTVNAPKPKDESLTAVTKCAYCGGETLRQESVSYGTWGYAGDVPCVHEGKGYRHVDECQVRLALYPYTCTNCEKNGTEVKVEEQFVHIGNRKKIQYVL